MTRNHFFGRGGLGLMALALVLSGSASADDLDQERSAEPSRIYADGWAGAGAQFNALVVMPDPGFVIDPEGLVVMPDPGFLVSPGSPRGWVLEIEGVTQGAVRYDPVVVIDPKGLVVMPDPGFVLDPAGFVLDPDGLVVMPDPGFVLDPDLGGDRTGAILVDRSFMVEISGVEAGYFASPSQGDGQADRSTGSSSALVRVPVVLRGDADGNRTVDVDDAVALQRTLQGTPPGPVCEAAADADGDGALGPRDVLQILRWATGEETHPAVAGRGASAGEPLGLVGTAAYFKGVDGLNAVGRSRAVVVAIEYFEEGR